MVKISLCRRVLWRGGSEWPDLQATHRKGQKKKHKTGKPRASCICACASSQLAKANAKCARTSFLICFLCVVRFWAFLDKGSAKTREEKSCTWPKKSPGKHFSGWIFF
jgi:hypothetical protein